MTQDIEIDLDADTPTPKKAKAPKAAPILDLEEPTSKAVAQVEIDINQPALAMNAASVADMPNDRDLVNQLLGQIQMANSFARIADVVSLQKLKYIKDNKIYRSVAGVSMISAYDGEKITDVGTWAGFCKALGLSVSKVDEDLINLNAFGEDALKQLSSIGAGYRELRQYRKLPEDQKTALIEAAQSGDKNQFLDLAETIIERHAAEKAEQTAAIAGLTDDLERAGKRANNMDAEIERLESEKNRLLKNQRITNFEPFTEDVRQECMHLQAGVELHFDSLNKLFESVWQGEHTPEQHLRVEQVFIAINTAIARGVNLLNDILETVDEELPKRVQGQNIMTPEEARRWSLEWESLQNAHNAAEASRQIERDAAKPRGRGRPAKSQGE